MPADDELDDNQTKYTVRDSKKGFYAFIYCIGSVKCLYACIYWKKWRFGQVLPLPDTQTDRQTTEDRATQLLYSIQFKLSHAIRFQMN